MQEAGAGQGTPGKTTTRTWPRIGWTGWRRIHDLASRGKQRVRNQSPSEPKSVRTKVRPNQKRLNRSGHHRRPSPDCQIFVWWVCACAYPLAFSHKSDSSKYELEHRILPQGTTGRKEARVYRWADHASGQRRQARSGLFGTPPRTVGGLTGASLLPVVRGVGQLACSRTVHGTTVWACQLLERPQGA